MHINYGSDMSFEAIVFFDLLGRPITKDEISLYSSKKITQQTVKVLGCEYSLPQMDSVLFKGVEHFSFFDQYTARNLLNSSYSFNENAWKKVGKYSWIFRIVPFVKLVSVCNTLAFATSKQSSDIDLFVVTSKNRMFTARLILTFLCHILGVRRHGAKISQRFCLSFFVSEDHLNIENILLKPMDIYMIYWMRSLKVVYGRENFDRFLNSNDWYKGFYADVPFNHFKYLNSSTKFTFIKRGLEKILSSKIGDLIENKLQKWQLQRAGAKQNTLNDSSGTVIAANMLKFHDNDRRGEFFEKWERGLKGL